MTRSEKPELRSGARNGAWRLSVILVNNKTRALEGTISIPTSSHSARAMAIPDGGFIAETPESVIRYSKSLQPIGALPLVGIAARNIGIWKATGSPDGAYLSMCYDLVPEEHQVNRILVNTETPAVVRRWSGPISSAWCAVAVFDDGSEVDGDGQVGPPGIAGPRIMTDGGMEKVIPVAGGGVLAIEGEPTIDGPQRSAVLRGLLGKKAVLSRFRANDTVPIVAVSADGSHVAVVDDLATGWNGLLGIPAHNLVRNVLVYDVPKTRIVLELPGKAQGSALDVALALSRDGHELAWITDDAVLHVISVP